MKRPLYEQRFSVDEKPEEYLRHVNNLRYLEWFIDLAIQHADALGWGMSVCKEMGLAWVAQSHSIEYISPAYQGDELLITTWIDDVTAARVRRSYACTRTRDGQLIAQAKTVWVIVEYETGRPKAFPKALKARFDALR